MSDSIETSGHHQQELLKMALESVKTEEQAFQLLENNFEDAIVIKSVVFIENRNGILIILFSIAKGDILQIYSTFGNSPLVNRIRTFEKYDQFALDTIDALNGGGMEKPLSDRIGRSIYKNILGSALLATIPKLAKRDYEDLRNLIQNGINLELKIRTTKVNLDVEKISSIRFRTNNVLAKAINPISNPYHSHNEEEAKKVAVPVFETDPDKLKAEKMINEIQSNYEKVVMCKTLVSPVAGIEFNNLKEDTKLLFMLPFQTEDEIAFAKSLGAVNKEGQNRPIAGTFLKLVTGGKNEFHIFAKGPNGILFRAFEERPVRLATPKKVVAKKEETSDLSKMFSIIIGVLVVLLAILVFFYLS